MQVPGGCLPSKNVDRTSAEKLFYVHLLDIYITIDNHEDTTSSEFDTIVVNRIRGADFIR
jgi:hypothetical protein